MAEQEGVQENVSQEQVSEQSSQGQTQEAKPDTSTDVDTEANRRAAAARREAEQEIKTLREQLQGIKGVLGDRSPEDVASILQAQQQEEEATQSELEKVSKRLEKTSKDYEQTQSELEKERNARLSLQKEYALRDSLRDAGINGERISLALRVADTNSLSVTDEGRIEGLEDVVNALQEASPEWFGNGQRTRLVSPDARQQERKPVGVQDMSKEDFNRLYDEAIRGGHVTLPPAN